MGRGRLNEEYRRKLMELRDALDKASSLSEAMVMVQAERRVLERPVQTATTVAEPWPYGWPNMCAVTGVVRGRRQFVGYRLKSGAVFSPMLLRLLTAEESQAVGDLQPDLDDDGTAGHLKGMVREAGGDEYAYTAPVFAELGGGAVWCVCFRGGRVLARGPTEGEACKAALERLAKREA